MSLRDLNRRHLGLLGFYSTRYAVRGGVGLVFLLLVLVFGLFAANMVIQQVEDMQRKVGTEETKRRLDEIIHAAKPYVEWAIGGRKDVPGMEPRAPKGDDPWATYLLEKRPALLSAILLILVFSMPFLVAAGAFNQYSGDVSTRGIRFLLLRTERANIYFGRFLGMVAYAAACVAVLVATIVIYMGFALKFYGWGELASWGLYGFAALTLLCVPYIAVCGWISAAIDSSFGSLSVSAVVVGGVPLLAFLTKMKWEHGKYLSYVLPWGVQNNLLHHSAGTVALTALACLGYTAAFLALGYRHFARRDL